MLLSLIQWAIISFLLIALVHYLYSFFKTNLTIPKVKDLVNRPADLYKEIYETIEKDKSSRKEASNKNTTSNNSNANSQSMKDELKMFLNNLNNAAPSSIQSNNDFGTMSYNSSSFSNF